MFARGFLSGSSDASGSASKKRYDLGEKGQNTTKGSNATYYGHEQALVEGMGFAKNMRNLREELKTEMDLFRVEIKESLASAIEDTKSIMREVLSKVEDVADVQGGNALKAEFSGVREEFRNGLDFLMQCLEGRLSEKTSDVLDEINMLRRHQEEVEQALSEEILNVKTGTASLENLVSRSGAQITQLLQDQQSFSKEAFNEIRVVSQEDKNIHNTLVPYLDAQFQKHLKLHPVNVDFAQVLHHMDKSQKNTVQEIKLLHSEIAKIQQELNVDFAEVLLHIDSDGRTHRSISIDSSISHTSTEVKKYHRKRSYHKMASSGMALPGEPEMSCLDEEPQPGALVLRSQSESLIQNKSTIETDTHTHTSSTNRSPTTRHGRHGNQQPKRMRNYFCQTDGTGAMEQACQTDPPKKAAHHKENKRKSGQEGPRRESQASLRDLLQKPAAKRNGKPMGADAEAMKKKARQNLIKPQYNPFDDFWETGCCQSVAKNAIFQNVTFVVIILNAIWIGIDLDWNDADLLLDAHPVFLVAENLFCTFFTFEVVVRFGAFKRKVHCLRDYWFIFDLLLVSLMILETWVLVLVLAAMGITEGSDLGPVSLFRVARMAKMARMARMVRLVRSFPELVVLLKGIVVALRSVAVFIALWAAIVYVYAVVCKQMSDGSDVGQQYFETIPAAMNTLFLKGIIPEFAEIMDDVGAAKPLLWPILMSFIILCSLTMMNMLVGVLVQVVSVLSTVEKESSTVSLVASSLREAMASLDKDTRLGLSQEDYRTLLVQPEISSVVQGAGVDVVMLIEMSDLFFESLKEDGEDMSFEGFIDIILSMRNTHSATVKDMSMQLRFIQRIMSETTSKSEDIMMSCITEAVKNLRAEMHNSIENVAKTMERTETNDGVDSEGDA